MIFTTGSRGNGTFQPWVALSNGGTYPLNSTTNFSSNATLSNDFNVTAPAKAAVENMTLFPNPTRNRATLTYTLQQEGEVSIQVLDFSGRLIKRVFEGTLDAGVHQTTESFDQLPKGMYFYNINIDGQQFTHKLVVQ